MINAADAMKIVLSHPAVATGFGGLVGAGGALVYNAFSQPTLDEYGNPIESNDINPLVAAGIGSGIGLVGGMGAKMMIDKLDAYKQQREATIQQARNQSPQIPEELMPVFKPRSQEELEASLEWLRKSREAYRQYQNKNPSPTVMRNPQLPSGFQELTPEQRQRIIAAKQQMQSDGWDFDINYWNADNVPKKGNMGMGEEVGKPVVGWDAVEPSMLGETNYIVGRGTVKDFYYPDEQYAYSLVDGKRFKDPNKLPKLIQTPLPRFQEEFVTTRLPLANNTSGWNVVSAADPKADIHQKWLESEAVIRGQNPRPQVIGDDLFDADGNMILDYPQKKIV